MDNDSIKRPAPQAANEPDEMTVEEYMTLQQMAKWLSISRTTAWSIVIQKAEIPHVRLSDRVARVTRSDLEDYLRRCRSNTLRRLMHNFSDQQICQVT